MPTIDARVAASTDDASETSTGNVATTSTSVNIDETGEWIGWRVSVTIPDGATIDAAYLTCQFDSGTLDEPDLTIYGEDTATPAAFAAGTGTFSISGRSRTTASVNWGSTDLGGPGAFNSPSIVSIIEELMGSYSYASGAYISILMTSRAGDANRDARIVLYDGDTATAPLLHIEYTEAGGSSPIQGTTAGTCTVTGVLKGKGYVDGSTSGVASQTAHLKALISAEGSADGTSSVTGTLVGVGSLVASESGQATSSGTLSAAGYLEGSSAGTSTATADIKSIEEIAGFSDGTSSVSGTLTAIGYLVGSIAGTSTADADIQSENFISGQADGTSSVTGTLAAIGYLSGETSGSSSVTGDIKATTDISGSISGTSTVTGDIKAVTDIAASSDGIASVSGTLYGIGYLNGEAQGTSTALISVGGFILGETSGQATVSGTVQATGYIEGSSAGTSSVTGDISGSTEILGTSDGTSSVSGSLYGIGYIDSTVGGSASVTGNLTDAGGGAENFIFGESAGTSSVTGSLTGATSLEGSVSGTSQVNGQLHGKINIFGVTSGQVTVGGIISGNAYIQGLIQGTGTQSGSLWAKGYLSGTVLGLSTASLFVEGEIVGEGTPMLSAGVWKKNQPNTILFVLTDAAGVEVTGLGSSFTLELSKAGATFQASAGTKSEVGSGWYKYVSTASEANTSGPIALTVTGAGIVQQNLEYVVEDRVVTAVEFTYTLVSSIGSLPIAGANVNFSVNSNPANSVWSGITDSFGVARDLFGNLPRLSPGNYFIFSDKPGFVFETDQETVS